VLEGYFRPSLQRAFIEAERLLARRTDLLVAVSPQVRDSLLELGIGTPDKFRVIALGFDLGELLRVDGKSGALRESLGIPDGAPLVGIVGRLVPIKDHRTLISAIARLDGVHLAIVGDGELRSELEAVVEELGLGDRVHFAGWQKDVAKVVSDLDVVALSSLNEGTPVSLIEALAASVPVVATDVGGVRFVVSDGENGYVCPPSDPEGLANRISKLLDDAELRASFGSKGREMVRTRFDRARLVRDIEDLYAELLEDRRDVVR